MDEYTMPRFETSLAMSAVRTPSSPSSSSETSERRHSFRPLNPPSGGWSEASDRRSIRSTPQPDMDFHHETPSGRKTLRPRKSQAPPRDYVDEVMQPLGDEERASFKGWVEVESDPALFNFILRQYGVQDVKIQEVLGLEDEMLALLPQPVYGLIFLFRYRDDDADNEESTGECPKHVWFANQISPNLCATAALFNILMNATEVDLGEKIGAFKASTADRTPISRGQMLSQDEFIRQHHNSFARRMEFLNADLSLSNDVTTWQKRRHLTKRTGGVKRKRARADEENAFHFIAYVPIEGGVWRLDGLQNRPVNLGPYQDDWRALARANIYSRIAQYSEDGVQFNLLSLCRSPLKSIPEQLAQQIKLGTAIEAALTTALPDWRQFIEFIGHFHSSDADGCFGLTKALVDATSIPANAQAQLDAADTKTLMDMYQQCIRAQSSLKGSYMEEESTIGRENDEALRKKQDLTPMIYDAMKTLAEKRVLKEIIASLH